MLEYLPSTTRATIIIMIELFWSLGSIFEYLMAMFIVPSYGWRILTALSALPISIVAVCMYVSIEFLSLCLKRIRFRSSYLNHLVILLLVVIQKKLKRF